jgi:hypothetical protein
MADTNQKTSLTDDELTIIHKGIDVASLEPYQVYIEVRSPFEDTFFSDAKIIRD